MLILINYWGSKLVSTVEISKKIKRLRKLINEPFMTNIFHLFYLSKTNILCCSVFVLLCVHLNVTRVLHRGPGGALCHLTTHCNPCIQQTNSGERHHKQNQEKLTNALAINRLALIFISFIINLHVIYFQCCTPKSTIHDCSITGCFEFF